MSPKFITLVLLLFFALLGTTLSDSVASAASNEDRFDHSYRHWNAVLRGSVSDGLVDYKKASADKRLAAFLKELADVPPEAVVRWSREQQVAFYINAYNALTFQTIIDALPVASIRDIKPNPWDASRWTVGGRTLSLDTIEHQKLRKALREPRVHFVLVCAARSCPGLPARAIVPERLEKQLDAAARSFFADKRKNRINRVDKRLELSPIMHWFGKDFVGWKGAASIEVEAEISDVERAVVQLIAAYSESADREFLASESFTIVYNEYDWSLNSQ